MTEEAYNKKLADLQQYIPFMENMIAQLKDPKWKPREAQLNKMESLYNMITDKNKKWKYETLLKCEEVILKLQTKVKASKSLTSQIDQQSRMARKEQSVTTTVNEIMNVLKFNTARAKLNKMQESNETPKSPSPTPDAGLPFEPKIIPIEPTTTQEPPKKFLNIVDPNELITIRDSSLERYTKERPDIYSSAAQSLVQKKTVFDRLGPVIADPHKPLLTDDELAQLSCGAEELYLQGGGSASRKAKDDAEMKIELNLKITPRIVPVPCSKPKCPKVDEKVEKRERREKEVVKAKTVKVDGNASADIFGSLLSSIDTKIIEETKKKDHKKEHHGGRERTREREHSKYHAKKHERSSHGKTEKIDKAEKPDNTEREKGGGVEKKEEKTQEDHVSSTVDIPVEKPKRLADKYHPKPRSKQPPVEEVGSTSRIEEKDDGVRLNRDPRRRSPPLSVGFFNQNVQADDRQRIHSMEGGFQQRPRPIESTLNYDGRLDTGWTKYSPQLSPDMVPGSSFNTCGQTQEHRFPPYNTNNAGFSRDQISSPMAPLRFEQPIPKFEPPQNTPMSSVSRFEPPPSQFELPRYDAQAHYDHQRHFDHVPKRFDPAVPYGRFEPQPVPQNYIPPTLLSTPILQPTLLPTPPLVPQQSQHQSFPRKSFNPFEPLNSEKEKDEPEPSSSSSSFNKRESYYCRYNFGNNGGNRPKFDRPRFERARPERFDRRERFGGAKPSPHRRSVDEEDHKNPKTDKVESSPTETFTSPLESLYSNPKPVLSASQAKAALDKFRIPKKKPEEKKEEVLPQVDTTDRQDAESDSEEDTPLSRKIKRRLRMKIEDSDNEPEVEAKTEKSKKVVEKVEAKAPATDKPCQSKSKKSKPKKALQKPKVIKEIKVIAVKIETSEEETSEIEKVKEEDKKLEEEESPTRRLRARPQRTVKSVIVPEEKKTPPRPRRTRRVTRSTRVPSPETSDSLIEPAGNSQESEESERTRKIESKEVPFQAEQIEEPGKDKDAAQEDVATDTTTISTEVNEHVPEKEKVKNELLADIKKTNLKMEETDVLQFILQNYKKIKKIFKSDSSSEDEGESRKRKEKKQAEKRDPSTESCEEIPTVEIGHIASTDPETKPAEAVISKATEIKQAISITRDQFTMPEKKAEIEKPKEEPKESKTTGDEDNTKDVDEKIGCDNQDNKTSEFIDGTGGVTKDTKGLEDGTEKIKDEAKEIKDEITEVVNAEKLTRPKNDENEVKIELKEDVKAESKLVVPKKPTKKKKQEPKVTLPHQVQIRNKKNVKKVIVKKRVGRNTRLAAKSKKARRSELDKLHDDIKEMLMGNEIMTSSGKRSCTMVQRDERADEDADESSKRLDTSKANLKALVEKSDFARNLVGEEGGGDEDLPPPVLEKMVATPLPNEESRKKVVKRKSKWASGIIRKKVRRRMYNSKTGEVEKGAEEEEDDEDDFEVSDVVEHDKKYFFVHSAKIGCKLCGFKGKLIVQHYRMSHPESEVLISRIEQGIAEYLINDAIRNHNKYDDTPVAGKKLKCNFKCPFCLMIIKDTPSSYYNHLCSHTGEYRYGCLHCPYRTFNASNVRTHICQAHSKIHKSEFKAIYPDPQVVRYVFGYLCSECNFVQLIRATVEEHSMVYHPGTPEIRRINMGGLLQEDVSDETRSNLDDCIEAVASGASEIRSRSPRIPAEVKELTVSDLLSQIERQDAVVVKVEPREVEPDEEGNREEEVDARPIELAAFMCDADLDIEREVETDREKMSQWINENARKPRTSIADRLQIKLVSEDGSKRAAAEAEKGTVGIGEEVTSEIEANEVTSADTDTEKLINIPEPEKEVDPLDISTDEQPPDHPIELNNQQLEGAPKKIVPDSPPSPPPPVQEKMAPVPSEKAKKQPEVPMCTSFFQKIDVMPQKKDNFSVSKIINRLQEKLTTTPPAKSATQETRFASHSIFTNILDIGPMRVVKSCDTFMFSCKVPNCGLVTDNETAFAEHCDMMHKDFVYVFNTGKCNVCSIKFEYEGKFVTVHDVYLHMMSAHKEFFKRDSIFKLPHDVPNVLSQGSDSPGPKFPFVITNVTSLASKDNSKVLPSPPPLIPLIMENKTQDASNKEGPEIKLPIIASVQSLAVPKSPKQVLTSGGHSKRTLVLRDIPVKECERTNKKCPLAIAALMKPYALNALYKCPKYDCSYSTIFSITFQKHLAQHPTITNTLVPCLYCDYKVLCNYYVIHLEVRHGHCKFGCGDCFYRATSPYFVTLHRSLEHPNEPSKILHLKVLSFNNKASSDLMLPLIQDLICTYNCSADGNLDCPFKTLYFDEYLKHAEVIHQVNRTQQEKEALLHCWLERGVGPFQCKHCKKATLTYQEMGMHQAVLHFQKQCSFYYRKFVPTDTVVTPEQIDLDSPTFVNHLVLLPEQASLCDYKAAACSIELTEKEIEETEGAAESKSTVELEPEQVTKVALPDEPEILAVDDDVSLSDESDPLCLDEDTSKDGPEDKMPAAELTGCALYKCNCGKAYDTMALLKSHILDCVGKPYECVHCGKERKSVLGLLQHYREHGRRRFKCSLCTFKHWQQEAVRSHMRSVHNVSCAIALPAVMFSGKKADPESDDYVLRPRQTAKSINDINLKVSTVTTEQSNVTGGDVAAKPTFGPDDIPKLPRRPIYTQPVKCAMCDYETKVRTNMERHLQMHVTQNAQVPESAPVNPVPCLDKNEKMFDKMVNLASSSHVGGRMGGTGAKAERAEESVPGFVPGNGRFVCGAENCKYQCLEEAMLRRHVLAFHSTETTYKCIHCNTKLIEDKTINVDLVLKHLKLHDAHLYRCSACPFMHNLKHKVERHLSDKHPEKPQNLIVVRELKDSILEEVVQEKERPWRCGICKFRCSDLSEIRGHAETKHNIDAKYKCALCPVRSDTVEDFTNHFNVNHEGQAVDFIVSYYKEGEARLARSDKDKAFNTTPLWQRKKSVKHIRGILVDESTSKVLVKKKITKPRRSENDDEVRLTEDEALPPKASLGTPQLERTVGRKRKIKQGSKDDADDVIMIEDDDLDGKKPSPEENSKGRKRKFGLVDLNKLTTPLAEDVPKAVSNIANNALDIVEVTSVLNCDKDMDVSDTLSSLHRENLEKTIELSLERTASILAELDKSILLDEADDGVATTDDLNKISTSDIEIVQVEEVNRPSEKADQKEGAEKRCRGKKRVQRTAKMRAFQNMVTTMTKPGDAAKTDGDLSRRNRPRPKKPKPNDPMTTIEIVDDEKDPTVQDVERMTREELLEGNLIGTYGPYGTPWEGKMKCPLCEKFISKTENEFRYHLYEELQCAPYKCNACEVSSASPQTIEMHTKSEHNDGGFTVDAPDTQIEGWIKMTIAVQSRIIKLEDKSQMWTSSPSGNFVCLFCNYRSDKYELRQKHLVRHFIEKPFSCNHCGFGAFSLISLKRHVKCASYCAALGESITVLDPTNGFLVNPYLKNFKKSTDAQELLNEDKALESENAVKCGYCEFVGPVAHQTEHCQTEHPSEAPLAYRYKCNVCPESFVSLVTINHHFFVKHPGIDVSFNMNNDDRGAENRFVCEECQATFDKEQDLRAHLFVHSNVFKCVYCPQEFSTWRKILMHVEFKHAGKEVVFKFTGNDMLENGDVAARGGSAKGGARKKNHRGARADGGGTSGLLSSPVSVIEIQATPPRLNSNASSSSVLCIDDSP